MMLERERDGEVEREKRDLLLIYNILLGSLYYYNRLCLKNKK